MLDPKYEKAVNTIVVCVVVLVAYLWLAHVMGKYHRSMRNDGPLARGSWTTGPDVRNGNVQ